MKSILYMSISLLLLGCGHDEIVKSTQSLNIEGNVYKLKNELYSGTVLDTNKQGRVLTSFRCVNGKIEGSYLEYHRNGRISIKKNYTKGVPNGKCKTFSTEGKILEDKTYKNGKLNGKYFHIQEAGKYEISGTYINGLQCGTWTYVNKYSQKIAVKGNFERSNGTDLGNTGIPRNGRVGKWQFYDNEGLLEEIQLYESKSDIFQYLGYYPLGELKYKGLANKSTGQILSYKEYDINGNITYEEAKR